MRQRLVSLCGPVIPLACVVHSFEPKHSWLSVEIRPTWHYRGLCAAYLHETGGYLEKYLSQSYSLQHSQARTAVGLPSDGGKLI